MSQFLSIGSGKSKSLKLADALVEAGAASGSFAVTISGASNGSITVKSKRGAAPSRRVRSKSSSTWMIPADGSKKLVFENQGPRREKFFVHVKAAKRTRRTPTPKPTAIRPSPTATHTPTNTATPEVQPTATNTATPPGPTATATNTPSGSDLPPNVGHSRNCAFYKSYEPIKVYWVATDGADVGNAGTEAAPFRTIQKALSTVQRGEAVYVKAGTYAGGTIFGTGPETTDPIIVRAAPIGNDKNKYQVVTVDRKSSLTQPTWGILNAEGASSVVFMGFRVTGTDARTGVRIVNGLNQGACDNTITRPLVWGVLGGFTQLALVESNTIVEPQQQHCVYFGERDARYKVAKNTCLRPNNICWHNNGSGSVNRGALIEQNLCEEASINGGAALNADGLVESVIRNNIFRNCYRNGIALFQADAGESARDNLIYGNTFYYPGNTGYFAIAVNENATGNKLFNNIFFRAPNNLRGSLAVHPSARPGLESNYNIFAGSGLGAVNLDSSVGESNPVTLAAWQALGYDLNSKVVPLSNLFVNPSVGDLTLLPGSPAKAGGTARPFLTRDFLDVLRGNPPSIGAFE